MTKDNSGREEATEEAIDALEDLLFQFAYHSPDIKKFDNRRALLKRTLEVLDRYFDR